MKQMKHVLAIGVAALVAMASAVPLAEAGHGGGFGGGGFGGHGFGGGGFGGHAFSGGGFGGHSFSGHAFSGSGRGFAVGPRGGFAYSGPRGGRAFVGPRGGRAFIGPRGGVYASRHYSGHYYAHNGDHDHDHHFHHGHRVFVGGYGFYDGYYDGDDYGYYDDGGCGWLYRNAIATGSPYWWNRYQYCVGNYD
jgi:hypothetical protein